ncbi:MAG: phosphoribosylamine--glycine ligase [Calditrichaeota bacterium]|nr:phosphoribosylamine--glycine ligase [Calditrichota bacterium]
MKVLVLGGGGREHALIWKLSQNPEVNALYCIPGNGGICEQAICADIPLTDFRAIMQFVRVYEIDFTVVGPEQPLVDGIVDAFQAERLPIFGPMRRAARLEGSKIFAKQLMQKYGIPTAAFGAFDQYADARRYLDALPEGPVVVKADGLAAGKGSLVCPDKASARQALEQLMQDRIFQEAGSRVVIEEFMEGEEASLFVLTDGTDYVTLLPAQDFKRVYDNDQGKNTGGMGSYAPTPFVTPPVYQTVIRTIVEPTLEALQREGIVYRGVLYCGLMLTADGPRVVEFNCRFGDPETQVVLPLLETDLLEMLMAIQRGELRRIKVRNRSGAAVCVVLASGGYPDAYEKGKVIQGLDQVPDDVLIFHAGTQKVGERLVTSGGRVLGVTALEENLEKAVNKVYQAVDKISFEKMHYRRDIARKAIEFLKQQSATASEENESIN